MKQFIFVLAFLLTSCGGIRNIPTGGEYGTATLFWTPPFENTDGSVLTDLKSYTVYYGTSREELFESRYVPLEEEFILLENLPSGKTYYFAVTATNSLGVESEKSNIVHKSIN